MTCPKCNAEMKVLDYSDELSDGCVTREWECKCPECDYHGKYREFYKLEDFEWERVKE